MAVCQICNEDMLTAKGCNDHVYLLHDGKEVKPIKVGEGKDWLSGQEEERCGDCNASIGETHHVGCDTERYRECGRQYISCDCDYSDKIIIRK